jgi:hypothetical protein
LNHNPFAAPDHQARRLVPVVGIGSRNQAEDGIAPVLAPNAIKIAAV